MGGSGWGGGGCGGGGRGNSQSLKRTQRSKINDLI